VATGAGLSPRGAVDASALGLPTDEQALIRYLANSYPGVGQRTAEKLVETFGRGIYGVMQQDPDRIGSVIPSNRAEKLLQGWQADLERRRQKLATAESEDRGEGSGSSGPSRRRTRRGSGGQPD
jgi:hypothetical protein